MNETNRTAIILFAALWIVLMAILIFITWAAHEETVDRLGDMVEYLDSHREEAGSRLVMTLGALVLVVLALLVIVIELAPDEEEREIRVEQAGATTIIPAQPLRLRLEEALNGLAQVSASRARVFAREKGVGIKLDLTVTPDANLALVTQEASRVVVETMQADLGLPVSGRPTVRVAFGPAKAPSAASSVVQPPSPPPAPAQEPPSPEPPAPSFPSPEPPAEPAPGETAAPAGSQGSPPDWPWWRPKPEPNEKPPQEGTPPDEPQSG